MPTSRQRTQRKRLRVSVSRSWNLLALGGQSSLFSVRCSAFSRDSFLERLGFKPHAFLTFGVIVSTVKDDESAVKLAQRNAFPKRIYRISPHQT